MVEPEQKSSAANAAPLSQLLEPALYTGVRRRLLSISLFVNLLGLAIPVFVLQAYDRVIMHAGISTLQALVAGVLLAIGFDFLLRQARARLLRSVGVRIDAAGGRALMRHILSLPLPLLESKPTAYWLSLFQDLEHVRLRYAGPIALLLMDLPFVVLAVVVFLGVRGGLPSMAAPRARIGVLLVIATTGQVALGFATLAVTSGQVRIASSGVTETLVATTHQTLGAVILALAASLLCWAFRPVR